MEPQTFRLDLTLPELRELEEMCRRTLLTQLYDRTMHAQSLQTMQAAAKIQNAIITGEAHEVFESRRAYDAELARVRGEVIKQEIEASRAPKQKTEREALQCPGLHQVKEH